MSRPKGSKNKPKISGTNGTLVVKNKKIATALANHSRCAQETAKTIYYIHDITCSADPAQPMGSEGCSCEMYKRAKRAEERIVVLIGENKTLSEKIEQLERDLGTALTDILIWQQKAGEKPSISDAVNSVLTQNKAIAAPKTGKQGNTPPKEEKKHEKAENKPESKPAKLSPFLKSRQALKNGQK